MKHAESFASECRCYQHFRERAHTLVANCSSLGLTKIPSSLPRDTDWLLLSGNKISALDEEFSNMPFLKQLSKLDLKGNRVERLSKDFIEVFVQASQLLSLDISDNNLTSLPPNIKNIASLNELWISGNQFKCRCDSIWMKDWILDNKTKLIPDHKSVKCQMPSGKSIPIIAISKVNMGCIDWFALWKIIGNTMFQRKLLI